MVNTSDLYGGSNAAQPIACTMRGPTDLTSYSVHDGVNKPSLRSNQDMR
jgi:hypothetical protein